MRDIFYKYDNRGMYTTEDSTAFGGDTQMKIIVEPHDFSISVSGDVLRNSAFDGCNVLVSSDGEVVFYDAQNNIIGKADKGDALYKEINLVWKNGALAIAFGHTDTIDHYPNCDGEHDRWSTKWIAERTITLCCEDNSIQIG